MISMNTVTYVLGSELSLTLVNSGKLTINFSGRGAGE